MNDDLLDLIPGKISDLPEEIRPKPFPIEIEPFDSKFWMTPDQKQICDLYLGECKFDQGAAYAIVRPNFKKYTTMLTAASRFFKMLKVRRYLYIRAKELTGKVELTQEMILKDLIEVKEMAMGRKPSSIYIVDEKYDAVEKKVKVVNLAVAKQTLEQLGKYHELAMWTEKAENEISYINFNFNMGDKKQERLIDGLTVNREAKDD